LDWASKYFRFFTHVEGDRFSIFFEHGLNRELAATVTPDHRSIILNISIPLPPDEIYLIAGLHPQLANSALVDETFQINAPEKLDISTKKIFYFPSKETPVWAIYQFKFAAEEIETTVDTIKSIDLTQRLNPTT
jgi:hypothetical protein